MGKLLAFDGSRILHRNESPINRESLKTEKVFEKYNKDV